MVRVLITALTLAVARRWPDRPPAPAALDESFQAALVEELIRLTEVRWP